MKEEENRIAGTNVGIAARIPTNGVVPTIMQSERELEELGESFEVIILTNKRHDIRRLSSVGEEERNIALQAARIIVQAAAIADVWPVSPGTEIDNIVREGAVVDAAAARTGRDLEVDAECGDVEHGMRNRLAVAAHGVGRAVKDFGLARILVRQRPVPVRLRTGVAAFRAEQFVVDVGVVAVPVEEGPLSMVVSRYLWET